MNLEAIFGCARGARPAAAAVALALALLGGGHSPALAASLGKIQGKILAKDTGEPIGFADVLLIPADTTQRRVGAMANADGTFLIEAAPGRYAIQVRALSYATKRVEGVEVVAGQMLPFSAALSAEAIQQEEIVVEAKARQNTEAALLSQRKKATSVGDAVSAEQVRKSPDDDAGEVLRRVTGLSVADGKYVFVRGLGERYSSTEVDGVRIASPEQNKRVVPLDLVPANLLENVVVQKTYTADRPGEFGGGDVQVHTKDFPGQRTWSVSLTSGINEGVTFHDRQSYSSPSPGADRFGYGADPRWMPAAVDGVPVPGWSPSNLPTLASMAKSLANVWSPSASSTVPNNGWGLTYGDEMRLFGHPLGLVLSSSVSRQYTHQDESQRFFQAATDTLYDYAVSRYTQSVQLGALSGLSYRISPSHTLHVRGFYTNSADDEVRTYQGADHNRDEPVSNTWLVHRNTRLMYVQREVLSGSVEGSHEFPQWFGSSLDWKFGRSRANREQPDRRELTYDRRYYFEGDTAHWIIGSIGRREFGSLEDNGWGTTISTSVPYRLGGLGRGKVAVGYDRQTKERDNFYRRLNLYWNQNANIEAPPESVYAPSGFDGSPSTGYIEDGTLNQPQVGLDNYRADQRVEAGYVSIDVPLGRRVRSNFGVRVESGFQDVQSFALFHPDVILQEGKLDNTDWLPSGNVTWAATDAVNVRAAASRTVSRPDLNELSPSPFLEYVGGMQISGNPNLRRALLDNYDLRVEAFPGLSEVLAAGVFYKKLHEPIEQVIQAGTPLVLVPRNSNKGRNVGVELEARSGLGRLWHGLDRFAINANASFISSEVELYPLVSKTGTEKHPLQGQADYLVNGALSYSSGHGVDVAMLVNSTGKRLRTLGIQPLPDVYQQPYTTLDATMNLMMFRYYRIKVSGKNLLDPEIRQLQADKEVSSYKAGRSLSLAIAFGW